MRTQIKSITSAGRNGVRVTLSKPDVTFDCLKSDLEDPTRFKNVVWEKAHARVIHPCLGFGRYLPQTKGQLRQRWQEFLEGK